MIRMKTTVSCFDGTETHPAGICVVPPELAKRLVLRGQGVVIDADDKPMTVPETIAALRLSDDDYTAADPAVKKVFAVDALKAGVSESEEGT